MRVAYFSPLNPQRSGISDYSEELLPHLAARAEIDLYVDGFQPANPAIAGRFRWFDYRREPERLRQLDAYDAAVYHVGNDHRYHAGIYAAALARPGVVVLHDFALQNFFAGLARERGDWRVYLDELEACHGARARAEAEETIRRGGTPSAAAAPLSFPLNRRLANAAEALVVHSEWARARLARVAPAVPVAHINLPVVFEDELRNDAATNDATTNDATASDAFVNDAAASDAAASGSDAATASDVAASSSRTAAGARRAVQIASFGHVTTEKGIERALAALAALSREGYEFHYTLVGQPEGFDVAEQVRAHGLAGRVTVTGFVTLDEFKARIRAADIAINLRERTVGETSASVCRIMAAGVPVIVSNVGWFAELPGDAVVKIDASDAAGAQLRAFLARLISDEQLRRRIGRNARRHVLAEHAIERSAARYLELLSETVRLRPRRRLTRRVSTELAALGVAPDDDSLLRRVAAEVVRLTPDEGDGG